MQLGTSAQAAWTIGGVTDHSPIWLSLSLEMQVKLPRATDLFIGITFVSCVCVCVCMYAHTFPLTSVQLLNLYLIYSAYKIKNSVTI